MKLTFAFALNQEGDFGKNHFGDSDKFAFYEETDEHIHFIEEVPNSFKTLDEEVHGSKEKGKAIVAFLKEKKVDVLVSRQFGKNIRIVNQHFIPVIIHEESTGQVLEILNKYKKWFKDELKNRDSDYMLFHIRNGILKSKIKAD